MQTMLDPLMNDEEEIYLRKEGIDRGIGYLVLGIVVLLFFLLTIVGMGRIHKVTDPNVPSSRYSTDREKPTEIGGSDNGNAND